MDTHLAFRSQRIAGWYIRAALPLFVLQVLFGLWLAANYVFPIPQGIVDVFPFATARAIHTNLLVLWMLLGFMGGTYFVVPEETGSEIFSERLALVQLVLLLGTGVTAIVGFVFGWTKGRPLLEIPRPLSLVVVAAALIFLFNVGATMYRARRWTAIQGTLLGGLLFLALLYLFALPFYRNAVVDWYYWWWVIHLWVEGAWELITGALMAFVLLRLTGVDRTLVEKWLYVEVGLVLFTGIVGTGHHYYWIGAPRYWLWWGAAFSALEPVPILLMVIDTLRDVRERQLEIRNRLTWTYAVGCAIFHFVGAGVWGFIHTLPQINRYTHGSQVTAAHGHLAFFGAYALLNLTVFYFAMPQLRGFAAYDERRGRVAFWTMCIAMLVMGVSFGIAGVVQSYVERVLGLGFMTAQGYMRLWLAITLTAGLFFLGGVLLMVRDLFGLRPARRAEP
jgi:nitric oxide reductase subunit B